MKKIYTIVFVVFCALTSHAQIVNIPSIAFKSILTDQICADTNDDGILDNDVDTNNDGQIQVAEALAVTNLNTLNKPFENITGINAFANLKSLVCNGANILFLNISGLTNLKSLDCSSNAIYSITLTGLSQLETLNCSNNELMTLLNFSGLNNLKNLNCSKGRVVNLDLTPYTALETLNCSSNLLTTLPVPTSNNIQHLDCSSNPLSTFDFSVLPNLKTLKCSQTSLTTIDVSALNNLESLNCSMNSLSALSITNLPNLNNLECNSNNITTLDLSQSANLKNLNCAINNLTALNLTNAIGLESLTCYSNSIMSLDTSTLLDLKSLNCSKNLLTTLNVNSAVQLETVDCNQNSLTVLEASNLVNLKDLNCERNLLTALSVANTAQLKNLNCKTNNLPVLNLSGLTGLETLECSFNHLTTLDGTDLMQLKSLICSNNDLTNINTINLNSLEILKCNSNELTALTITNMTQLIRLECANNHITAMDFGTSSKLCRFELGSNLFTTLDFSQLQGNGKSFRYNITNNPNLTHVNIKNGGALRRFSYQDTTGFYATDCPNLLFICADDFNLEHANAPNAQTNSYCSFNPGGIYNTISGTFTLDYDNNGCDLNDNPFAQTKINIDEAELTGGTFTNAFGKYKFFTNNGSFTVTPAFENPYFTVTPASAVLNFNTVDGSTQTQDFCVSPNGIHNDVEITLLPMLTPRPGFDTSFVLAYKNKGNQIMSGNINFTFDDAVLNFVSTGTPLNSQTLNTLNWSYSNLMPFEHRLIHFTLNLNSPQETPPVNIGDVLNYTASITPVLGDETVGDNTSTTSQTVAGSFDPNDKTCLEGNTLTPEMVGNYLHYLIRFQNKGTARAENVVITDLIDTTKFDMSSLQLTSSSHPQVTKITANKVEFQFQGINLPAETEDEPESHGYIAFKIKTLENLVIGDSVENKADIYFDYNFPVETNTATSIVALLGLNAFENNSVMITPNPTKGNVHINSKDNITSVQLYDVQGRIIQSITASTLKTDLDLSQRTNGIYFVKVYTEKGTKVEKIVKD
ncbi:T9SS type A sorting domain-containing protein [Flavobacterium sp.]|uniref:DUF7619 domain-containing protein n=1 Tax=Flavobacterium sp. TaxID=239 RepID=UPI00262998CA|nr:T9SS type A sorting domain-containing protein [Flavobacterium sp.]